MNYLTHKLFLLTAIALISTLGCQNNRIQSSLLGNSTSGSTVNAGRTQVIQATASDPNGVSKVEFYVNGGLTCTITAAPYNCSWTVPVGPGTVYQLQTKAYDPQGKVGLSQIVNVTSQ